MFNLIIPYPTNKYTLTELIESPFLSFICERSVDHAIIIDLDIVDDHYHVYTSSGGFVQFESIESCIAFLDSNYTNLERWAISDTLAIAHILDLGYIYAFHQVSLIEYNSDFLNKSTLPGFTLGGIASYQDYRVVWFGKPVAPNTEELTLLKAMQEIIDHGNIQPNRTGISTRSVFGKMFEYVMQEMINPNTGQSMYRLPLLTTKKMFARGIFGELKWFLNGGIDSKELERKGINIWKGNTSRSFLDMHGLNEYAEGETGPIYGFQWRHWGADYLPGKKDYHGEGIDQISRLVESLKSDPFSRRHVLSAWNVSDLNQMCLPPCFPAGTMVATKNGYKEIQNVIDNDQILTHAGQYKSIINRQDKIYTGAMYKVFHMGNSKPISATEEHPFLVKRTCVKSFEPVDYDLDDQTEWVLAKNLDPNHHVLCIPIVQEKRPVMVSVVVEGRFIAADPIDYFMVGIYVGRKGNTLDLEFIPPGWSILKEFSVFGGVCNIIPEWVQSLPKQDLVQFINGFESAFPKRFNGYLITTNEEIALSLQRIYAKIGIATRVIVKEMTAICRISNNAQGRCYADYQYLYMPILDINIDKVEQRVFNLEIAEDSSYTVGNLAVHNCHMLYQFSVHETNGQKYLSLMMTQRSCDTFLGLPFNLCSLGMLLFLMANTVDMKPYKIIHSIADMHIYESHIDIAREQTERYPFPFPYIQMRTGTQKKPIDQYEYSDIEIVDYKHHPALKADMIA